MWVSLLGTGSVASTYANVYDVLDHAFLSVEVASAGVVSDRWALLLVFAPVHPLWFVFLMLLC